MENEVHFHMQIFSPSTPLETISTCVGFVRDQSSKLQDLGIDVTYLIDSRFRRNVERTVSYGLVQYSSQISYFIDTTLTSKLDCD